MVSSRASGKRSRSSGAGIQWVPAAQAGLFVSTASIALVVATGASFAQSASSGNASTSLPTVEVTTTIAKPKAAKSKVYKSAPKPVEEQLTEAPAPVEPAQPTRQENLPEGALGTGTNAIDGYVAGATSSATKTNTAIKDIPQAISIVTRQQADDRGSESVGEALQYVPGVAVAQGEGHRDAVTIRGQQTTADFFVDGVRDDSEYYRDLYNVDALEVLKGPAAMTFGRGGAGGVINRVTKKADGQRVREATFNTGMYDRARTTVDIGDKISSASAFRLNAMYENSESFRDYFELERYGIAPTLAFRPDDRTKITLSYEYYSDKRTVDRGIPSLNGQPSPAPIETFFGNPDVSQSDFKGHNATATIEHRTDGGLNLRNHTYVATFDKVYANEFAVSNANTGSITLDGYINSTQRDTLINQSDMSFKVDMGQGIRHTFAAGTEFTIQRTDNVRNTETPNALVVPFANPTIFTPISFNVAARNWHTDVETQSIYIQDQLEITKYLELIGGLRFDRFDIAFDDRRTNTSLSRVDNVWSHRLGVVLKPTDKISIYAATSTSFLPGAGDQFGNLAGSNNITGDRVAPEEFKNEEVGFKWEVAPRLFFSGAIFQLDRENQLVTVAAGVSAQVGQTRTEGGELALTGYITDKWQISAGWGQQIARIVESGTAGTEGNTVPWVPSNVYSLWNRYQVVSWLGVGVGVIHQTESFAALDNTVVLPEFTRVDAAAYLTFNETWSAQANVENLFDEVYYPSAHNNNNITTGAPRSAFVTVKAKF